MSVRLSPSRVEEGIFEVIDGGSIVKEIAVPFLTSKIRYPDRFDSFEELERWLADTEIKLARKKVYQLLSARSYPSVQLLRKLKENGYSDSVCHLVLEEVKRLGYVQDQEFLDGSIEREFGRGYGPRYIEQKLKSKGLSAQEVRRSITPERQKEKIAEWIQKHKSTDRTKIIRSLQQRGFDFEIILQTIENFY